MTVETKRWWLSGLAQGRPSWVHGDHYYRQFITSLAQAVDAQVYLEIGVLYGDTIEKVSSVVPQVIAVDPNRTSIELVKRRVPTAMCFNCTSDQFFEKYEEVSPDLIFIDGDHACRQAARDIENSFKILARGGVVLAHDIDPPTQKDVWWTADSFMLVDEILDSGKFFISVLPFAQTGMAIISRRDDRRALIPFGDEIRGCKSGNNSDSDLGGDSPGNRGVEDVEGEPEEPEAMGDTGEGD
jgi:predicted O-methyltransferase YrrM